MADNNLDINITARADKTEVEDLSEAISTLKEMESDVDIDVNVEDSEVVNAEESVENLDTSMQNASNSSDNLSSSLSGIDSSPIDELGGSAQNAESDVEGLGNSLELIEAGALMSISSELSSIGSNAEGMAQDMNTAAISVGQLSTQTGVAEPKMISLINNISNATFPNDEAMMYVKSLDQIGVSSENLGKSATDLDRINDAFGLGAQTTNSLGQELSVLGVDMNNVSSSFNALAYANSNTVGGMQNYYTFLRKYDSQFNELGFNVDQASVIIAGATQKFGGGRAALTGLSDALKESNGDTKALEQALGLQAGSISNASQLTGEYEGQLQTLASEEAEHKTWLDQINAAWEDMSLLMSPVLAPMTSFLGLIGQAGSFAVGINGIVTLAGSLRTLELTQIASNIATKAGAAAQWLMNAAMSANPIMIVVLAIIALIAVLGYLYFNNEQVRAAIDALGQSFILAGQIIYTSVMNFVNWVISSLQNLYTYIMTLGGLLQSNVSITGNNIVDGVIGVMIFIATLPFQLAMIFTNMIARTLGFGNNFVQRMLNAGVNSVTRFMGQISSMPGRFVAELNSMLSAVGQWAATLPQKFWEAGVNAVKNFLNALGIHSPGIMQIKLLKEMEDTGDRIPTASQNIIRNLGNVGENAVKSFGNPRFNVGFNTDSLNDTNASNFDFSNENLLEVLLAIGDNKNGNVLNLTLNVDTVDKRERIDEIIEVIREYIFWDNKTAGRTV
ncbi:MAG: hypothetical protein E7Z81_11655 [Methanobrevibacter sp.]|jgi:hypothetical protein|uniref:hypothetical protein n=1 Tax=Methanobrevibacter sp. TaxID=66852 RepID=UPI0025E98753|nr:hypothetical protein [Methanobrevibacter sp.]MBE6498900.1 hypothetical protein [Methanobrevibacter sp.]